MSKTYKNSAPKNLPTLKIVVASLNPVKINAVRQACSYLSSLWQVEISGLSAVSGVADQPMSDAETKKGAINRVENARQEVLNADLVIAMEGGVYQPEDKQHPDELWSTVWVAVADVNTSVPPIVVNGARFQLPNWVAQPILAGIEMAEVVANFVGEEDVRSKQGMIGVVTNNLVDRTSVYANLVQLAVGIWFGRQKTQGRYSQ